MYKKYAAFILAVSMLMCSVLSGCNDDSSNESSSASSTTSEVSSVASEIPEYDLSELGLGADYYEDTEHEVGYQLETPDVGEEIAIMHTSMGDITLRFFPEAAPKAVENFLTLAEEGYYDGVTFHRVINDFMIQGGDPTATGAGGESANGEAFEDEFSDKLFNIRGSVAMANSGADTNGSQFFINQAGTDNINWESLEANWESAYEALCSAQSSGVLEAFLSTYATSYISFMNTDLIPDEVKELYSKYGGNPTLDGQYNALDRGHTVFAQVIDGMDVVDSIAAVSVDESNKPTEDVVIESIEITTYNG